MPDDGGRAAIYHLLETMEVARDGVLFVHSAFKNFARDGFDANIVIEAFIDYMAPGTVLLPTMSWRYVKPDKPFFDELETPSNTGILTEKFRNEYASRRSLHPTHSVAGLGELVDDILGSHHLDDTPCAAGSPFGRHAAHDGFVLLFGITMDCCTLIHHVEEIVAIDHYLMPPEKTERYTCRDRHGGEVTVNLRRHLFLPRNYWQFQDRLASEGGLKVTLCGRSICRGFRARDMMGVVTRALEEQPDGVLAKPGQRFRMM